MSIPAEVQQMNAVFVDRRAELARRLQEAATSPIGLDLAFELSVATDAWIVGLWRRACQDCHVPTALSAVGGYGRGELSLHSDIDMVVEVEDLDAFRSDELREAVERFMTWAREARVKVAHAVRTREQTMQEFRADLRTAVAYLDARPLELARERSFEPCNQRDAIAALRGDDEGHQFIEFLLRGYAQRLERFGQTIYLLEPEIKNGKGGLRDLHCIRWAGLVRSSFDPACAVDPGAGWDHPQLDAFRHGLEWLLRMRALLHLFHERRHDRLNFPDQEKLASLLLPEIEDVPKATEALMRRHYRTARSIGTLAERFLRHCRPDEGRIASRLDDTFLLAGGQLAFVGKAVLREDAQVFDALELASAHDVLIAPEVEHAIERRVSKWGHEERDSAALNARFLALLTDLNTSPRTSQRLLDLGILTAMIPEFEPVVCHVQHDVYHVYTTDTHLLKCLEFARAMARGEYPAADRWPLFQSIADEIRDRRVFLLSALFHDIGKNRGGDHSRKGAALMDEIGTRLGLGPDQIDLLTFLVRDHLSLSDTARRYDISDLRIIRDLAARIRTLETLNLLSALTVCDMSTVRDDLMNDWNASLLSQLYRRLRSALEHGVESSWRRMEEEVEHVRRTMVAIGRDDGYHDPQLLSRVDEFFRDIPASHVVETAPEALWRQFQVYDRGRRGDEAVVLVTPNEQRGSTEVIVTTPDIPGALAAITGTISACGLNILAAQIVTTSSARTLDIFQVARSGGASHAMSPSQQQPLLDERRIERFEERLLSVLEGEESVEELLLKRIREKRLAPRPTPEVETLVRFHDDMSDDFTVIEIRAPDRIGLLYEIASTLLEFDVNVHLSKIDSLGTQVIDTFYVETMGGGKLPEDRCEALGQALEDALRHSALRE